MQQNLPFSGVRREISPPPARARQGRGAKLLLQVKMFPGRDPGAAAAIDKPRENVIGSLQILLEKNMPSLKPLTATGIGSMPFTDPEEAVALILEYLPQVPFWPQMVRLGFREEMNVQAARGLPALRLDEAARVVEVDPEIPRDEALARFYESVLSGDLAPFAWEPRDAQGFFALLAAVAAGKFPGPGLKGQLSGPVTLAGVIKDHTGKPILYDRESTQRGGHGLARKAAWQAARLREVGKEPVIFFDEPYLAGVGA